MSNLESQNITVLITHEKVFGKTYPHRELLKKLGCSWNSDEKYWERERTFSKKERKKIYSLGLKVEEMNIKENINVKITPIDYINEKETPEGCFGYVKELESSREYTRKDNTKGIMQKFVLVDNSGCVPCILWNLFDSPDLTNDTVILIQNPNIKINLKDKKLEIHSSSNSKIWKISEVPDNLSKQSSEEIYTRWITTSIQMIKDAEIGFNRKFIGMVTKVQGIYDYDKNQQTQFILSFVLVDESEAIKVTLFGDMSLKLLNFNKEEEEQFINLPPLDRIDSKLLCDKINNLIGQSIIIKGTVEKNRYTHLLELKAKRFYYL